MTVDYNCFDQFLKFTLPILSKNKNIPLPTLISQFLIILDVVKLNESDLVKILDIKHTVLMANHASIRSIDHLGELIVALGKESDLERLRLHHTKCSSILFNVINASLKEDLISQIGEQP